MKVRVTIETLDNDGAVDSVSSYTESFDTRGVGDDDRALGVALAVALKGILGQWSTNCPDAWVYDAFFTAIDTGWGEALAILCREWKENNEDDKASFNDFMESALDRLASQAVT